MARGARGTEVARQAADLVLKDDRLGTVLDAIYEGRVIFDNLRTFVVYLLCCNVSEVLIVGAAAVLGAPLPFTALQILFLNLVTDVFPALALEMGEGDPGIMKRHPRPKREELLNRPQWIAIGTYGFALTVAGLGAFALALGPLGLDETQARSVVFVTTGLGQPLHALNLRSGTSPALNINNAITTNPWVWGALVLSTCLVRLGVLTPGATELLGAGQLSAQGWGLALGMGVVPLVIGQLLLALKLIDHTR